MRDALRAPVHPPGPGSRPGRASVEVVAHDGRPSAVRRSGASLADASARDVLPAHRCRRRARRRAGPHRDQDGRDPHRAPRDVSPVENIGANLTVWAARSKETADERNHQRDQINNSNSAMVFLGRASPAVAIKARRPAPLGSGSTAPNPRSATLHPKAPPLVWPRVAGAAKASRGRAAIQRRHQVWVGGIPIGTSIAPASSSASASDSSTSRRWYSDSGGSGQIRASRST